MSDEVEIPVEIDAVPVDVSVDPAKQPTASATKSSEAESIEDFKALAEKAKSESAARMAEADRKIREAYEAATRKDQELVEIKRGAVAGAVERLKIEKDAARRDLTDALKSNDPEAIAEAQDKLSMANATLVEAEKGKVALEEEAKTPRQVAPPVADNSIEGLARGLEAAGNRRSAAWIRAHPEFAGPGKLNEDLTRAHYFALSEGHAVESDGYFKAIEGKLGLSNPSQRTAAVETESRAPVSAPVTRSAPASSGVPRKMPATIRLTAEEAKTADELGIDRKSYAVHLYELAKEGKIQRTF